MTRSFSQNWKILAGAAIAAVLLGSALSVGMFIPKAEASHTVGALCASSDPTNPDAGGIVQHWDKIIFQIVRDSSGSIDPSWLKTPLDIKVLDDPGSVAHLDAKIRGFIDKHPSSIPTIDGTILDADAVAKLKIDVIDVEYAIVCVSPFG